MLATVLTYALAALSGAIVALKVIAPLTKNTVDDKVLEYAEDAEALGAKAVSALATKAVK